jgi:hypothetical protein
VQIRAKFPAHHRQDVEGGATVTEGQPLFQNDRRQYETAR